MMRKLIAILSGVSAIGFAVALANTNPNTDPQAGNDSSGSQSASSTTTTTTTKTCTDDNGVTYYRGHTGFDDCMVEQSNAAAGQMAGTVNKNNPDVTSDTTTTTKSTRDAN